ncbi:MAG: glycosyltransferase family 2 protein [Phycisphaerae bacterium]
MSEAAETPLLSIIVPTHSRPTKLRNLLADLAATPLPPGAAEVLVVVDGPDDGPLACLRALPPALPAVGLTQPHGGPAAARNLALQRARGAWVLFLNDDARVAPTCVPAHLARIRAEPDARRAYLGRFDFLPAVVNSAWRRLLAESSMLFFYNRMKPDQCYGYRHFWTCNISVRADLLREVGAFRAELHDGLGELAMSFHEDIELGWRLQRAFALEVCFAPEIVAAHDHELSPRDYFWREYRSGRAARAAREVNRAFHDEVWPWVAEADQQYDALAGVLGGQFKELFRELECLRQRSAADLTRSEMQAQFIAHLPAKRAAFLLGYAGREFGEFWPDAEAT